MSLGTAVIVGVGPGLGLELARIFGNAGHPVAMLARDKAKLDTFAKELALTGLDARGYEPAEIAKAYLELDNQAETEWQHELVY
jgi:short-subunit dehydrogenase